MDLKLHGKRVVVTGSSRGIGLAIARAFAKEEARVALTGRTESDLSLLLPERSRDSFWHTCDFSIAAQVEALKGETLRRWGGVDVLVCNVGTGKGPRELPSALAAIPKAFDDNFTPALNAVSAFLPPLLESGGNIILVSSIAGVRALTGPPLGYTVAKTALHSLAAALAREVGSQGVRVNTVAPGNIHFEGGTWDVKLKENRAAVESMLEVSVPLRRLGRAEEIADTVLFLASERAGFVTGAVWVVDGGQTA